MLQIDWGSSDSHIPAISVSHFESKKSITQRNNCAMCVSHWVWRSNDYNSWNNNGACQRSQITIKKEKNKKIQSKEETKVRQKRSQISLKKKKMEKNKAREVGEDKKNCLQRFFSRAVAQIKKRIESNYIYYQSTKKKCQPWDWCRTAIDSHWADEHKRKMYSFLRTRSDKSFSVFFTFRI